MVQIYIDGKERKNFIDWKLSNSSENELTLIITYSSGKTYRALLSRCKIIPTYELKGKLISFKNQPGLFQTMEKAIEYGGKYTVVKYLGNNTLYCMKSENINIEIDTNIKDEEVFGYFRAIAQERIDNANDFNRRIAKTIVSQLEEIVPYSGTALHAYCYEKLESRTPLDHYIFPFGINESQLVAVENAFSSQVSIIEGPPGTGKTQTILNIISNIILNNETVAIISNNNSAVENIYQKMERENLDYLIAQLGNNENKNNFFNNEKVRVIEEVEEDINIEEIDSILAKLKKYLSAKNKSAKLIAMIDEIKIEKRYLEEWYKENFDVEPVNIERYNLKPEKIAELIAYIDHLSKERLTLKEKMQLLFRFKIIKNRFLQDNKERTNFIYALQLMYYNKQLKDNRAKLLRYEEILEKSNYDSLINTLSASSMRYFKVKLCNNLNKYKEFTAKDYKRNFGEFMKRYPIIGSSTHSIINSLSKGAILDYVIIDEASQQDIVPGILGLGCSRNIIIVGDRKQLSHIPIESNVACPKEAYNCVKNSLLDSFVEVFNNQIPISLLREHYRCHPKIIQYCNQQFYDGALIPMTMDQNEHALELILTGRGNHTRRLSNLREIESLKEVGLSMSDDVGFIAPYNKQVSLAESQLPQEFVKATIHKFQGRECNEIIFSTVLDNKPSNQKHIEFVDNPELVNVAVSRARKKFTLVTGNTVFDKNNQSIAALIRYMKYYADDNDIYDSPLISAFDLLYDEYDRSLEKLKYRLNPDDSGYKSEQIATVLLSDIFLKDKFKSLKFHKQVYLIQLISIKEHAFTDREIEYMHNRASCDFVIYFKLGKMPLSVIEIDGGDHEYAKKVEQDHVKNSILKKAGIPILRIKTIDSHIEDKIEEFISACIFGGKE